MTLNNADWSVFRLNECDTVAAPDLRSAINWYTKEYGINEAEAVDTMEAPHIRDTLEVVWTMESTLVEGVIDISGMERRRFGGDVYIAITFEALLAASKAVEPFIIATSEM